MAWTQVDLAFGSSTMLNGGQPQEYDDISYGTKILISNKVSLTHIKTDCEFIAQYRSSTTMVSTRLSVPDGYMN